MHDPLDRDLERRKLEQRWLDLTRAILPGLATQNDWPICRDHCFQRILLDAACEGRWYDHIEGRPAYKSASDMVLMRAVKLGERSVVDASLVLSLNRQSLLYRGKI